MGRFADDCFGLAVDDVLELVLLAELDVAGFATTLEVSCAAPAEDADALIVASNSAAIRRRFLLVVNTNQD